MTDASWSEVMDVMADPKAWKASLLGAKMVTFGAVKAGICLEA